MRQWRIQPNGVDFNGKNQVSLAILDDDPKTAWNESELVVAREVTGQTFSLEEIAPLLVALKKYALPANWSAKNRSFHADIFKIHEGDCDPDNFDDGAKDRSDYVHGGLARSALNNFNELLKERSK